jgi:hypothetical protein
LFPHNLPLYSTPSKHRLQIDLYVRRPNQHSTEIFATDQPRQVRAQLLRRAPSQKMPTALTLQQVAIARVPCKDQSSTQHFCLHSCLVCSSLTLAQLPNKKTISYQIREPQQLRARRHIHRHRQVRPLARHQLPQPLSGGVLRQFRPVPIRDPFPFGRVLRGVGQRNGRGSGLVLENEALDGVRNFGRELLVLYEHVDDVAQRQSGVELQAVPGSRDLLDLEAARLRGCVLLH